jgi:hypothetical protein
VAIRSRSRDGVIGRDDWEVHGGCESAYVAMDPDNPRYTYAGCYLGLIDEFDTQTRTSRSVKAYSETGLGQLASDAKYRFNWNAPIHVSVHDPKVIYHGANVLLKSSNRGFDWSEASPDLTRNEDDKQGQGSGPYTNENIEQYNTIFSFAESPHDAPCSGSARTTASCTSRATAASPGPRSRRAASVAASSTASRSRPTIRPRPTSWS